MCIPKRQSQHNDRICYSKLFSTYALLYVDTPNKKPEKQPEVQGEPWQYYTTVEGCIYKLNDKDDTAILVDVETMRLKEIDVKDTVSENKKTYKVTEIKPKVCRKMQKLETVNIGSNVIIVGAKAFADCPRLKVVTVGRHVKTIEEQAFAECPSLVEVTLYCTNLRSVGEGAIDGTNKNVIIYTPRGKLKDYRKLFKNAGYQIKKNIRKRK